MGIFAIRSEGNNVPSSLLAGRLRISVPGVGYSVEWGEIIARDNDYQLIE